MSSFTFTTTTTSSFSSKYHLSFSSSTSSTTTIYGHSMASTKGGAAPTGTSRIQIHGTRGNQRRHPAAIQVLIAPMDLRQTIW